MYFHLGIFLTYFRGVGRCQPPTLEGSGSVSSKQGDESNKAPIILLKSPDPSSRASTLQLKLAVKRSFSFKGTPIQRGTAAYDGYLRAVSQIVRAEGTLALWSGLKPTLLGPATYSKGSFQGFL